MVEQSYQLDILFGSLSDPTRRDILKRVAKKAMSIGEIALHYRMSFAAVAKHLKVLELAGLIHKNRHGKEQIVTVSPPALASANAYLENYRELWENRLDSFDRYVNSINKVNNKKGNK
jgi:DNA-binding transcriptional ArsR family regulator